MRTTDYNSSSKAFVASATNIITFTSSDVPSDRVTRYHFTFTQAGSAAVDTSLLTRLRIKSNGVAIWDLSGAFLRAFLFRFSKGNYNLPPSAITAAAAAAAAVTGNSVRRFTVPFDILDAPTKDAADVCQFPMQSNVTIELTITTGANQSGAVQCGYTQTDVEQACYSKLLGSQMNIAASAASGRFNIAEDGIIEGIGINTLGLSRLKIVLNGQQVFHASGPVTSVTTDGAQLSESMIWESQQLDCPFSTLLSATVGTSTLVLSDSTINDPIFVDLHCGMNASPGSSYIELQTSGVGSTWGGVSNECVIYSVVPFGGRAAGDY